MKFKCPECGCKKTPRFIGTYKWWFVELSVYECKDCHKKGFLGEFAPRYTELIEILH